MPTHLHILHVDDEPLMLDAVRALLDGEIEVDRALSLAAAQEMLTYEPYDVLLVDLLLGDSDGVATVEALRGYGIPIVVLSALDAPEVLAAAAAAGAEDYITKASVNRLRLINRIRFVYTRHQRRVAYERQERDRKETQRKRYLDGAAFEALKPFISCANVAMGSRQTLVGVG